MPAGPRRVASRRNSRVDPSRAERLDVLADQGARLRALVDEEGVGRPPRQRLEAERSGAGEEIEDARPHRRIVVGMGQDVEDRLAQPVRGRADRVRLRGWRGGARDARRRRSSPAATARRTARAASRSAGAARFAAPEPPGRSHHPACHRLAEAAGFPPALKPPDFSAGLETAALTILPAAALEAATVPPGAHAPRKSPVLSPRKPSERSPRAAGAHRAPRPRRRSGSRWCGGAARRSSLPGAGPRRSAPSWRKCPRERSSSRRAGRPSPPKLRAGRVSSDPRRAGRASACRRDGRTRRTALPRTGPESARAGWPSRGAFSVVRGPCRAVAPVRLGRRLMRAGLQALHQYAALTGADRPDALAPPGGGGLALGLRIGAPRGIFTRRGASSGRVSSRRARRNGAGRRCCRRWGRGRSWRAPPDGLRPGRSALRAASEAGGLVGRWRRPRGAARRRRYGRAAWTAASASRRARSARAPGSRNRRRPARRGWDRAAP